MVVFCGFYTMQYVYDGGLLRVLHHAVCLVCSTVSEEHTTSILRVTVWLKWMLGWLGGESLLVIVECLIQFCPIRSMQRRTQDKNCSNLMRVDIVCKVRCKPISYTLIYTYKTTVDAETDFLHVKRSFVPQHLNDYATVSPIQSTHIGITPFCYVTWQKYDPTVDHCFVNTSDGFSCAARPGFLRSIRTPRSICQTFDNARLDSGQPAHDRHWNFTMDTNNNYECLKRGEHSPLPPFYALPRLSVWHGHKILFNITKFLAIHLVCKICKEHMKIYEGLYMLQEISIIGCTTRKKWKESFVCWI